MRQITIFGVILISTMSYSQIPQPVDLNITNITQDNTNWCWAAVAQQIINWQKGYSPSQCQLVANTYNADVNYCCQNPQAFDRTGTMQQIQSLIYAYGGHYSSVAAPTDPLILYQALSRQRPIIIFLQTTPYVGHFIVLRGMEWVQTPYGYQPVVYINDPMQHFTQPIYFSQLVPLWRYAIVVY